MAIKKLEYSLIRRITDFFTKKCLKEEYSGLSIHIRTL